MSDETISELSRRITREVTSLERRVDNSVDLKLYVSERAALLVTIGEVRSDVAGVEGALEKVNERLTWNFRAALTGIVFPVIVGIIVLVVTVGSR